MKIKDELIKFNKEVVYDIYESIIYDPKDYDNITRSKMLDEIVDLFNKHKNDDYMYCMCTKRELEFLKNVYEKKIKDILSPKYYWEISTLHNKCIFSLITLDIYDDMRENVKIALDKYEEKGADSYENLIVFMIGVVRTFGELPTTALAHMVNSIYKKISVDGVNAIMGSPLFHSYCGYYYSKIKGINKEIEYVYYRDYFSLLDDLDERRSKFSSISTRSINLEDFKDMFYYGMPIRINKVKKLYDKLNSDIKNVYMIKAIDIARVLNDKELISNILSPEDELFKLYDEAFDYIPSCALNGISPNEYEKNLVEEKDLNFRLSFIEQNDAHLSKNAVKHFYKLYNALLEYTNDKYNVVEGLKNIYGEEQIEPKNQLDINEYLFNHREIIDDFIKENKYKFSESELEEVREFKNAVKSETFIIAGFEREYTMILDDKGKMYMVKGLSKNLDRVISKNLVPSFVKTTLLMFEGNIIYNGVISAYAINFGNGFKEMVLKEINDSIKFYHL